MAATRPYGETFWGKPFYLPSRPERKVEAPVPVYPVGKTEGRKIPGSKLPPLHYDPFVEYDEYKNELQSFHSSVGYQHVGLLLEEVLRDQLASWPKWSVSSLVGRIYSFSKEPRGDVKILELLGEIQVAVPPEVKSVDQSLETKLTRIYSKYDPSKLDKINVIIQLYKDRPAKLRGIVRKLYGGTAANMLVDHDAALDAALDAARAAHHERYSVQQQTGQMIERLARTAGELGSRLKSAKADGQAADSVGLICMVCDRRFTSKEQLSKHERLSTEHLSKVARRDQLENRKPIDVSAAAYTIKGEALTAAALDGDCLAIRTLLRVGADINYVHKYERGCSMRSMTPLIAAVQASQKEAVIELLHIGSTVHPSMQQLLKHTPMAQLRSKLVEIDWVDELGYSALHWACFFQGEKLQRWHDEQGSLIGHALLQAGADAQLRNRYGETPMQVRMHVIYWIQSARLWGDPI